MFFKQVRIRQFNYIPRYYKPEPDEEDQAGPRIKFRRLIPRRAAPQRSVWVVLILIAVIIFLLRFFIGAATEPKPKNFKFEEIKVETIK
ncbi:MAG: hypothetical protein ONB13_09625 [candidate division KSB1 bacterium]|nr:hypothetical protein [candidate division KSB1 bacterium]MDZ7334130.1 hypothetical protein [candidate division KSB1 bacterium]MDZ7356281.1 hypothetical protein [candidate division KSB1 bacterium]MDZ7376868.1 hypothetical protein [candidate division KSB1 bacterium]MDZ7401374.1 hypothetical protein [candidate division KSB1 bacterium]